MEIWKILLKIFFQYVKSWVFPKEYDYMIATEHINSIFNLISILKYKFSKNIHSEYYLPFRIKNNRF